MTMREKNYERWRERTHGGGGPGGHDDMTRYGRSSEYGANFRDDSSFHGNRGRPEDSRRAYEVDQRTVSDYGSRESPYHSEPSVMEKVGRFFGIGPKGYKRSDQRIQEDVSDALMDDAFIDATHIEVTVKDGEVMLEGWVDDRSTKRRTEDVAGGVRGVRDVHNHLRIRPLSQSTVGAVLGQPESKDRSIS